MKLKALFATALLSVAGFANAAITQSTASDLIGADHVSAGTGGSELVLSVFNSLTGDSFSLDLGIAFNDALNITPGVLANVAGPGGNSADWIWGVYAYDAQIGSGTSGQTGTRLLTTGGSFGGVFNLNQAISAVGTVVSSLNGKPYHSGSTSTNGSGITNGDAASFGTPGTSLNGNAGVTTGSVGDTVAFNLFVSTGDEFSQGGAFSQNSTGFSETNLGAFSFLANNGGGFDLVFSAEANPIPVPAAVWLFGSALMGLVGVKRRKS